MFSTKVTEKLFGECHKESERNGGRRRMIGKGLILWDC